LSYQQYKEAVSANLKETIQRKSCQPILFIGSGFSRRFCKTPSWQGLLEYLAKACPEVKSEIAYHIQKGVSLPAIGATLAQNYHEWAWGAGRPTFPQEYFAPEASPDIFVKHKIAELLEPFGPDGNGSFGSVELDAEIQALREISPHAVITTNYDLIVDRVFHEYKAIVGQQVIGHAYMSIGEIFKIHGCVSDPSSMVFTDGDYERLCCTTRPPSATRRGDGRLAG
jgi:hypothetical protein